MPTAYGFSRPQANKRGFIKGLSDNAEQLTAGFFKIEKVIESLRVRTLLMYVMHSMLGR